MDAIDLKQLFPSEVHMISAPWTPKQVEVLRKFQQNPQVHPYTCTHAHSPESSRVLEPTIDGWICLTCSYTQSWAFDWTMEPWRKVR